jgi:iron-sulfur cluster assembly accessory protein
MIACRRILPCVWLACALAVIVGCREPLPQDEPVPDRPATQPGAPRIDVSRSHVSPILELTPAAADKVRQFIHEGQARAALPNEPLYLRVRLVAGGCCGFLHKLDLDPDVSPEDHTFSVGDIRVVVWQRQVDMFRGTRIDYIESPKEKGFAIKNPNFEGEALKKWLPQLLAQDKKG